MTAVVRVKRRIDEEPLSAFILNSKRRKLENEAEINESLLASKEEVSTILKFAGTVHAQDENVTAQLKKLTKDEAKQLAFKCRKCPDITQRSRQEMKENTQDNRFKIVNCYRTLNNTENDDLNENPTNEITIVDIEKQKNESQTEESRSSSHEDQNEQNFVYDLYLPENDSQTNAVDLTDSSYLSVRPFDDLVYEFGRDEESDSDSEDSNDENYYKNDYPDTDEKSNFSSIEGINRLNNSDFVDELSSDAEEENNYVHSIDMEASDFEDDVDCMTNSYRKNDSDSDEFNPDYYD